jgi:glutamate-1-semialdehyde 2,1-aminomutase
MSRAQRLLAHGGFDGIVQRPLQREDGGLYPQFAVAASGYEFTDSTGQTFIDWANGWGPVCLGYRHPEVEEAIREQLVAGPTLSLMHPVEVEVAGMLVDMIPCAEMVAFGKNGSDVVTAAVRVIRAVSGNDLVLHCGMHGFHDWWMCKQEHARGIPRGLREFVCSFPYNDLDALAVLLEHHRGRVAGIVMEPTQLYLPEPGFLEGVRELADQHGVPLVFDEIVTAFRLANGGAQEHFGVVPDLACVGKALANGMPLAAVVGKREYMQYLPSTGYGMTFRGETLSLAAARAVLRVLQREPVTEHLAQLGLQVRQGFEALCARHGVRCELSGHPARSSFVFYSDGSPTWEELRTMFLTECLKRGLLTNGTLLPTHAMDEECVRRSLEVFDGALGELGRAVLEGHTPRSRPQGGSPFGLRPMKATGFLDHIAEQADWLVVGGWLLLRDGLPDAIELHAMTGERVRARRGRRPDLEGVFPAQPAAAESGYTATLPAAVFSRNGQYEFVLHALRGGRSRFRCHVLRRPRRRDQPDDVPFSLGDGVLYI